MKIIKTAEEVRKDWKLQLHCMTPLFRRSKPCGCLFEADGNDLFQKEYRIYEFEEDWIGAKKASFVVKCPECGTLNIIPDDIIPNSIKRAVRVESCN